MTVTIHLHKQSVSQSPFQARDALVSAPHQHWGGFGMTLGPEMRKYHQAHHLRDQVLIS